jgi:predicted aconitase with swiveling domain
MTQVLVACGAEGEVLVLTEPLSFWGGVDETSGAIVDVHHPQYGSSVAGRVLVMPSGRGSSSSSSVLAELIRAGKGPVAILLGERDPIIALGALVAEELYGQTVPVVVLTADEYERAAAANRMRLQPSGELEVTSG